MDYEERKKAIDEASEGCSKGCSGCLEFIIEVLTLCAVLKILFLM